MQQRGELEVALALRPEAEVLGQIETEGHDAFAVLAGIPVVCLDHVAEHQRGAAASIVYNEPLLGPTTVPISAVALSPTWAPTLLPMLTAAQVQSVLNTLLARGIPQVALRFTALTGNSQIDDVFVDPMRIR